MTIGTLAWPLRRAARQYPEQIATIDGPTHVTYAELHERISRLGLGLERIGVSAGEVVGVLALNSQVHLECWLGIPAQGRVINDLNTRLAVPELEFMVNDSAAVALIADNAHLETALRLRDRCRSVRHVVCLSSQPRRPGVVSWTELVQGAAAPFPELPAETLAAIIYTGGTTGRPKGVMLSHGAMLVNAKHFMAAIGYSPSDRYLHATPMFHIHGIAQVFALTWTAATHVILERFDADAVLVAIERHRVTLCALVPTMIAMLTEEPTARHRDLSSLRLMIYAAAPMSAQLRQRATQLLSCDWTQLYGMTEAAPLVAQCGPADHQRGMANVEPFATRLASVGAPVAGVEAEVRDPRTGLPMPLGEVGEVWIRGPNLMLGYWNREEETAAALTADGWYRSGDAAYADEHGYLYLVDRLKDMIISGGENIYSVEVEQALHTHPDVAEAAVIGIPDERWGERVHAIVVARAGTSPTESELTAHVREQLAGYKVPRSVDIRVDPLPKSPAGKILKRQLRRMGSDNTGNAT